MISQTLIDECRELAHLVAPELDQAPLYVCQSKEIDSGPTPANCLGWALGGSRTGVFADQIPGWSGPGNLIVLDADAIRAEALPGQFERAVQNVALHEVSHSLPLLPTLPIPADYMRRYTEACRVRMTEAISRPSPEPGSADDLHDANFIRRCCHLYFRACSHGYDIPIAHLFGSAFWMTHAFHYLNAMLPEVIRMRDETFAEIEATAPPTALLTLWNHDLEFYRSFQEHKQ